MKKIFKKLLYLLIPVSCVGQKVQTVTVKATTGTVNLKVAKGQKVAITVNGRNIENQINYPTVARTLNLKDFSDWRIAFNTAIAQNVPLEGDTLTVDSDCLPEQHVAWDGDMTLQGTAAKPLVITCNFRDGIDMDTWAIYLGNGKKVFNNVIFRLGKQGKARWGSAIAMGQLNTTYDVTFNNCKWEGGFRYCFNSTQGHGTATFVNCNLYSYFNNIQFYSQLGPKTLVMNHCTLKTDESHCVYSTPINNYYLNDVVCIGSGKLAFDSRSDSIYPFKADFQIFNNCRNAAGVKSKVFGTDPMWHLWGQGDLVVEVDSCTFPMYTWQGTFNIKNSHVFNGGNGTNIYGNATAINCTGSLSSVYGLVLDNCSFDEMFLREGSKLTAKNSYVAATYAANNVSATYTGCSLGDYTIGHPSLKADVTNIFFDRTIINSNYKAIRIFGKVSVMDGIKFIGESYPMATY